MKKTYSPELVAELEELFPEYTEALKLAKENNLWLKNYIEGSFLKAIPIDDIFKATSLKELQEQALLIKRRIKFEQDLRCEWLEISENLKKEYAANNS